MKKKVRVKPTVPFYSNEPAVSRTLMADRGLTQNASLGNNTPKMVDKNPGRLSGIASFSSKSAPKTGSTGITTAKVGATAKSPAKLKLSGHAGAHQVGLGGVKLKI